MLSKVIVLLGVCSFGFAAPAPDSEADPNLILGGAPLYHARGHITSPAAVKAVVAPAPVHRLAKTVIAPNCEIQYEEIEAQECTPRIEEVCETKDVVSQSVKYNKICKEVVENECASIVTHSSHEGPHGIGKREAEATWNHHGHKPIIQHKHVIAHPTPVVKEKTIEAPCKEVKSEHCIHSPEVEDETIPIEQCHKVKKIDCVTKVEKIPKKICTPAKSVVREIQQPILAHPIGHGHGVGIEI